MDNRELNEKMAVLMGWERFTCGYFGEDDESLRQVELMEWMEKVGLESVGNYFIDVDADMWIEVANWNPDIDIADAWLVLEKTYLLDNYSLEKFDNNEYVFGHYGEYGFDIWTEFVRAPTAPLAICLAAEKASEAE